MSTKIMAWLDVLPQFRETGYSQRRDEIESLMAEAEGLVAEAAWLTRRAEELKGKAYYASLRLEGDAKARWTVEAVDNAKRGIAANMPQAARSVAVAKQ